MQVIQTREVARFSSPDQIVAGSVRTFAVLASAALIMLVLLAALWPQSAHAQVAAAKPRVFSVTTFEKGVVYPRYIPTAYGSADMVWQGDVASMKSQTAAQWIEIPVQFEQTTSVSTNVFVSPQSSPDVASFTQGIQAAHKLGLRVFFVPLMKVYEAGGWAGTINPSSKQQQAWFDSYWKALTPYVQAAAANKVEQMAISTEMQKLEQTGSPTLWNQLITRVRTVYKNTLTSDFNFSSLDQPIPSWAKNKELAMIGVSSYFQLVDSSKRVDPKAMAALWLARAQKKLDTFSAGVGKPVLISEIGYRNSSDALYQPWEGTSKAPADPAEQAGIYDAVLSSVRTDTHIAGLFAWGWGDQVHLLNIKGEPAAQTIQKWYSQT